MDFFQITCFKEHKIAIEETSGYHETSLKKFLSIITCNKNYLSKQVVIITWTLEKNFFLQFLLLEVWELFLF